MSADTKGPVGVSYERGSMSFRAFYLSGKLPENVVELFAKHALPSVDDLGQNEVIGWVGNRHMLDRVITWDNASIGGYLKLSLARAVKKVPSALLRSECKLEEIALLKAEGKEFTTRQERMEIRKSVIERLLPGMPPSISGFSIMVDENSGMLYSTGVSEKQMDLLTVKFMETTGVKLIPFTAESVSLKILQHSILEYEPTSFTKQIPDQDAGGTLAQDFLTWLWFQGESGMAVYSDGATLYARVDGPMTLHREGSGAHTVVLSEGIPQAAYEGTIAIRNGKKLLAARINIANEHDIWMVNFNAQSFAFRGLKLPQGEVAMDVVGAFQERMISLNCFMSVFTVILCSFLNMRFDEQRWETEKQAVYEWINGRC